jgi:hypothetical protein
MDLLPDDNDGIDVVELINFVTVAKIEMFVNEYHIMRDEGEGEPTTISETHVMRGKLEPTISESPVTCEEEDDKDDDDKDDDEERVDDEEVDDEEIDDEEVDDEEVDDEEGGLEESPEEGSEDRPSLDSSLLRSISEA